MKSKATPMTLDTYQRGVPASSCTTVSLLLDTQYQRWILSFDGFRITDTL